MSILFNSINQKLLENIRSKVEEVLWTIFKGDIIEAIFRRVRRDVLTICVALKVLFNFTFNCVYLKSQTSYNTNPLIITDLLRAIIFQCILFQNAIYN